MATTRAEGLAERMRAADDVKLVPFLVAGYPDRGRSIELGRLYAEAGAAAIEVGIPFCDPVADGPVIRRAGRDALDGGMTVPGAIEIAGEIAAAGAPVVCQTYLSPVLSYEVERFASDSAAAGVAGVIVPDLPVDDADRVVERLRRAGLDTVFLVAPTSRDERVAAVCRQSRGFIYCATVTGRTGVRHEINPLLFETLGHVRAHTTLPVPAGFGLSRPEHIRTLRGHADAAVVGSALVAEHQQGRDPRQLFEDLVRAGR
jgi:tryptophan synthase alpha chain